MKFKKIIYGLVIMIFIYLLCLYLFPYTPEPVSAQTQYTGKLLGTRVEIQVKNKQSAIIAEHVAVKWDTTALKLIFPRACSTTVNNASGDSFNTLTESNLLDTLSARASAWGVKIQTWGTSATADTFVIYGTELTNWFYSTTDTTYNILGDSLFFTKSTVSSDSFFFSKKVYSDIDSVRTFAAGTDLDSVRIYMLPKFYVLLCDSASEMFAGIVTDSVEIDTSGSGTQAGTGTGVGSITISGIVDAAVTTQGNTEIYKGDELYVATATGFLKPIPDIATADSFQVSGPFANTVGKKDSIHWVRLDSVWNDLKDYLEIRVGVALEDFFPTGTVYKDTIPIRLTDF